MAGVTVCSVTDDDIVWFGGGDPRDDAEAAFLGVVRQAAGGWNEPGLVPADTAVFAALVPLHLSLHVPHLPSSVVSLQVGYWQEPHDYGHALEGEWGDPYLLDSHVYGRDGLTVFGLDAAPEQFGAWAAAWLRRQLARPVERLDWLDGEGVVVASRWELADTRFVTGDQGFSLFRRFRRPPDHTERVR